MIAYYSYIKLAHILFVTLSGALFAFRGAAVLLGAQWAMTKPWRMLSYVIDACLLAAGVSLLVMLSLNPVLVPWVGVKLICLLLYIVLGSLSLKRAPSERVRQLAYAGALLMFGFIVTIALAQHPLGLFGGALL